MLAKLSFLTYTEFRKCGYEMKVSSINGSSTDSPSNSPKDNLEAIARGLKISVKELVDAARAAKDPTPAQARIVRMADLAEKADS